MGDNDTPDIDPPDNAPDSPQEDKMDKPSGAKPVWGWVLISVLFIAFGIAIDYFEVFDTETRERVAVSLISLGIAVILFGLLRSFARLKQGWTVGGALAGFVIVFGLLYEEPALIPPDEYILSFNAPLAADGGNFDKRLLSFKQLKPYSESYQDFNIAPQSFPVQGYGLYKIPNVHLPELNQKYRAKAKRVTTERFMGRPSSVPGFEICFTRTKNTENNPHLECESEVCTPEEEEFYKPCEENHVKSGFSFISDVYADPPTETQGWIVPSLSSLTQMHQEEAISYVKFSITTDNLNLPKSVDSYTYAIQVNGTPVYINGWAEEDTVSAIDVTKPFKFEFGLQNLNFSGADYGRENIKLTFKFFSNNNLVKDYSITRQYIALRAVKPKIISVDGSQFSWTGELYFGKSDGFEVFFWSSTNTKELVERRKVFFDDEDVIYQGKQAVAVVRPPLTEVGNESYGLVLGLVDRYGRIDFTFSQEEAANIENWLKTEVKGRRTRLRPETGFDHPLIKNVNVYPIKGSH